MRTADLNGRNFAMAARRLPPNPNIEQYRRQAKALRKALAANDSAAQERLRQFHPRAEQALPAKLADAQLVIAREHGFAGWPAFAAEVRAPRAEPAPGWPESVACEQGLLAIEIAGTETARALVLFVLAGNVGRKHRGIRQITDRLRREGHCTVLADLLTPEEAVRDAIDEELRFDAQLLSTRAELILEAIAADRALSGLPLVLFCAGAGGVAAGVILAVRRPEAVSALISIAGRPDLAGSAMARLRAPSLFVVGGEDAVGLGFTKLMLEIFPRNVASKLEILRGVGLRFEEGPAAACAAELAIGWLEDHLPGRARAEQAA
jgi:dienelactone hydrolase